jgi:hypothetical protein
MLLMKWGEEKVMALKRVRSISVRRFTMADSIAAAAAEESVPPAPSEAARAGEAAAAGAGLRVVGVEAVVLGGVMMPPTAELGWRGSGGGTPSPAEGPAMRGAGVRVETEGRRSAGGAAAPAPRAESGGVAAATPFASPSSPAC